MAIGLLIVIFLWVRPQGILPERKRVIQVTAPVPAAPCRAPGRAASTAPRPPLRGARAAAARRRRRPAPPRRPSRAATAPPAAEAPAGLTGRWCSRPSTWSVSSAGCARSPGSRSSVRRGTLTGLIGPNGAGKSTLLAMLAGTLPVSSGQIRYLGEDVTGLPAYRRATAGP